MLELPSFFSYFSNNWKCVCFDPNFAYWFYPGNQHFVLCFCISDVMHSLSSCAWFLLLNTIISRARKWHDLPLILCTHRILFHCVCSMFYLPLIYWQNLYSGFLCLSASVHCSIRIDHMELPFLWVSNRYQLSCTVQPVTKCCNLLVTHNVSGAVLGSFVFKLI